ncbi:MAG: alpha/beta fold hydrolase [Methyloglobulus sp.]|nr:hypothetical protein [Methyloglobulus sp.]
MKATLVALGIWLISLSLNLPTYLSQRQVVLAGRTVYYWQPTYQTTHLKSPIIIFSHGLGGCGRQSSHIMATLAEHGYWVFAPNHQDAKCSPFRSEPARLRPGVSFKDGVSWSDQAFIDRRDDILAVIEALKTSQQFSAAIEFSKLGLMGHSLGGYTVLGLAGARQSWAIAGINAVVAMSPYTVPYHAQATLARLTVPVMYQGADEDSWMTPTLKGSNGAYAQSPSPKFFLEFKGFGHLGWTDLRRYVQSDIITYTLAFLDYYVKADPSIQALCQNKSANCPLTHKTSGVVDLTYQTSFVQNDGHFGRVRQ